jgi:hypothetical protein
VIGKTAPAQNAIAKAAKTSAAETSTKRSAASRIRYVTNRLRATPTEPSAEALLSCRTAAEAVRDVLRSIPVARKEGSPKAAP